MNAALVSIIFTAVSAAGAFVAAPRKGAYGLFKILVYWLLAAACAFLIAYKLAAFALLAVLMLVLAPGAPAQRAAFFVAVFAALPDYYRVQVPFPGLNYLIELNHVKLAAIIILGPLFVAKLFDKTNRTLRAVDSMLLIYVLLTGFMSLRDLPITSMLRVTIDQFLLIFIPYVAISRSIKTQDDIDTLLKAFFTGLLVMALVAVVSVGVKWNYYVSLDPAPLGKAFLEYRNGILRIFSTVNTTLLAFLMGAAVIVSLYLRYVKSYPRIYGYGFIVLFGFVAFATGSRGGWLAALIAAASYVIFVNFGAAARRAVLFALLSGGAWLIFLVFQDGSSLSDQYGTISYRADFLRTSIPQIASRPLFGSSTFMELPSFQRLRQGEGIIDLVNAYLQVTLFYGLTGLGLFLGSYLAALKSGLGVLKTLPSKREAEGEAASARRTLSLLLALLLGYLAMLGTVSGVSYIWNIGFMLLAVLTAQVRLCKSPGFARTAAVSEAPLDPAEEIPESKPSGPQRLPYGARFVRRPES